MKWKYCFRLFSLCALLSNHNFETRMKFIIVSAILLNFGYSSYAGVSIRCGFGNFYFPDPIGNTYTCDNVEITLSADGSRDVTAITGTHQQGKTHSDVNGIKISNLTQVTFMPRLLETFFPNLNAIQLSNTNLLQISQSDLRSFPLLTFFKAYGSNLVTINGNLFAYNPLLRYISYNSNRIENIGRNLLTYQKQLTNLYFSGNVCINSFTENRGGVETLSNVLSEKCTPLECTQNVSDNEDLMTEIQELKQTLQKTNEQFKVSVAYYTKTIRMLEDELKTRRTVL